MNIKEGVEGSLLHLNKKNEANFLLRNKQHSFQEIPLLVNSTTVILSSQGGIQ